MNEYQDKEKQFPTCLDHILQVVKEPGVFENQEDLRMAKARREGGEAVA